MFTSDHYHILPDFYDEESFAVAKTLTKLQRGVREL